MAYNPNRRACSLASAVDTGSAAGAVRSLSMVTYPVATTFQLYASAADFMQHTIVSATPAPPD